MRRVSRASESARRSNDRFRIDGWSFVRLPIHRLVVLQVSLLTSIPTVAGAAMKTGIRVRFTRCGATATIGAVQPVQRLLHLVVRASAGGSVRPLQRRANAPDPAGPPPVAPRGAAREPGAPARPGPGALHCGPLHRRWGSADRCRRARALGAARKPGTVRRAQR